MKVGLQITSFTWPGGPEAIGPTLARIVRDADEAGFDSIWVMDHFFQIRGVGRTEEPMLEGWTRSASWPRHSTRGPGSGSWSAASTTATRRCGRRRDDPRRPVRRAGVAGHRRRLERGGVARPRVPVPAPRPTGSSSSRTRSARPRDVGGRARHRRRPRGPHVHASRLLNSPQAITPAPSADHDRRRRRAEDAPPGGPVRRRVQRVRRPGPDPPQVRGPARALRGDRPRPRRDRADDAPDRKQPTTGPRRRPRSSTSSATCPTPARST